MSASALVDVRVGGIVGMAPRTMRSVGVGVPALGNHVPHVVGLRSHPEMVETEAWRVVAAVQDLHAVGDRAVHQGPDPAVREPLSARSTQVSVSMFVAGALPFAARRFKNRDQRRVIHHTLIPGAR